jgi:hypothetical protein
MKSNLRHISAESNNYSSSWRRRDLKIRDLQGTPKPDYHSDSDPVGVGVGVTSKEILGVGIGVNSKEIFGVGVGFAGKIFSESESESKLLPTPIKFCFFLNE